LPSSVLILDKTTSIWLLSQMVQVSQRGLSVLLIAMFSRIENLLVR